MRTLGRYALVGLVVAGIYAITFHVLIDFFPERRFIINAIAFGAAVTVQYLLHSLFTFKAKVKNSAQIFRFAITIAIGFLFSMWITNFAVPKGFMSEWVGSVVVVTCLPILNLIIMITWVFGARNTQRQGSIRQ